MTPSTTSSVAERPDTDARGDVLQAAALMRLSKAIDRAAHLLPAQGPITVFIHHNTLHAFEELTFAEAVKQGSRILGCQPYLSEDRYRAELGRGRIRFADLEAVLREDLAARAGEMVLRLLTRFELRLGMLQYPTRYGPTEELLWFVAETDALRRVRHDVSAAVRGRLIAETRRWAMRDLRRGIGNNGNGGSPSGERGTSSGLAELLDRFGETRIEHWSEDVWEAFALQALWRVCCDGVATAPQHSPTPRVQLRHRDLLLEQTGVDADRAVHETLIPFCAAFLDQGLANWQLPNRDEGLYRSFCALYRLPGGPPGGLRRELARELRRLDDEQIGPLESCRESLELLGVAEWEWDDFLSDTLLALRGWAGMIGFLKERPDRAVQPAGNLIEFLAVRLVLERLSLAAAAREALDFHGPLVHLRDELQRRADPTRAPSVEQRAFQVFQLAQVFGWTPDELHRLNERDWSVLLNEIEAFSAIERRRIFQIAYERRFYTQSLDAIQLHGRVPREAPAAPRFQAMFCIDDREESLRRHVEELAPNCATFGIAGFYFVPMYYRGADDAHFVPLCPGVMRPSHWVVEKVVEDEEQAQRNRTRLRRAWGIASHQIHVGSRTFAWGALVSALGGVLASVPLVSGTFFPRPTSRLRKKFGRIVLDPPMTRLHLERSGTSPGPETGGLGFNLEEMAGCAERVLRDTGLTSGFARLVLMFGHGSTSMNNPHESAYDCGACGGARGGPNARAIAQILNDPRVRGALSERGIVVPAQTVFVGGMHNTSSEAITFYDLDLLPESHREEFKAVRAIIEQGCDRDAHERSRRFESAPLTASFASARQHVEGRAQDLAQTRPEWGHATNALCVVGRRRRTRGLFLDRRAFLNSYDPTHDDAAATVLTRILQAAVPVCAGISLEYYFSHVDNSRYGCGSKLPHNISALLGVMDGAASDLRTGLPWQMVEFHEPMRILFVVETTPQTMLRILDRNSGIGRLVRNGWFELAVLDPDSPALQVYRDGKFHAYQPLADQLPSASSSLDWYRGWRDHLEFAQIGGQHGTTDGLPNHV